MCLCRKILYEMNIIEIQFTFKFFFIFKVIKNSFEYKNEFDLQLEAYSLNAQKKCYHSRYWLFFSIFNIFQSVFLPSLIIGIIINVENVALHALFIYALELGIR